MKIGIITFWQSNDNYGQALQCFALQKQLISMGHTPFLIKYTPSHKVNKTSFQREINKISMQYQTKSYAMKRSRSNKFCILYISKPLQNSSICVLSI